MTTTSYRSVKETGNPALRDEGFGGSRGSFAAQFLVEREESLRTVVAASLRLEGRQELVNERGARKRQLLLARRLEHDRQVLLLVLDGEGRLEVPVDHLPAEDLQRPGVRRPGRQGFVERRERKAGLLREGQRFGDGHEVDSDEDLVGGLAELAGSGWAQVRDPLSHRLEDRTRLLQRGGVAADEERERPLDGALLAARDRRVQQ